MQTEIFDAIVIGAGQAGPALAARCSKAGWKTAVIERKHYGGTCVNVGCVPTKTMVASAKAMRQAQRGADYGFSIDAFHVDMARVKARKDAIVMQSRQGVENWMRASPGVELIAGHARFVGPATIEVNGRQLQARHIFINVGGRATRPPISGIDSVPVLDNTSILELSEVPEHLIIIGGSYIGLEFAQVMRRFGAAVTVVERSARMLPREDADVAAAIQSILEAEGIEFKLGADCLSLGMEGNQVVVGAACDAGDPGVHGSHVLVAVGRIPNTGDLGLDLAGIKVDTRGYIQVDEQCRTSAAGVWAVGDCNGRGAFTHTAWNDHEIVVANLFDSDPRRISDRIACYALFIDPPLGRIGMNEEQALTSGRPLLRAKMPMQRVGRAREAGETLGFMKVLVDAETKRLLGASILGLNGDEVIHTLLNLMAAGQPCTSIERTMQIHPTVSELLPTLLQQLKPFSGPLA